MGSPPDLADADDADLVRVIGRDAAALEEFYRRHVRPLTRYAAYRLGDPDAAGDVVAATFVAATESADKFDPRRGEAAGWLYGIANNVLAGRRRRVAAEARALMRYRGRHDPPPDEYGQLEDRLDAHRRVGPVDTALRLLPPAEQELVGLIIHSGMTLREAAVALGIRPGTARMRLSRARARLLANGLLAKEVVS